MSRWILATLALGTVACSGGKMDNAQRGRVALLLPNSDRSSLTAPAVFHARFETTKGNFVIEVHRDWSPNGADRFYYLVRNGFYDDTRFFRVVPGFMVQFGLSGDPKVSSQWRGATIPDDTLKGTNARGFVSYAMAGPGSRTTQVFINFGNNATLDVQGFSPFGQVTDGMDVVDRLYADYGDAEPRGKGPNQTRIRNEGNAYLDPGFPKLDKILRAVVTEDETGKP